MSALSYALRAAVGQVTLSQSEAFAAMAEMLDGAASPHVVAGFLSAMACRRPTVDELVGFAEAIRARMTAVPGGVDALCPCGTGGSGLDTANTSTATAFVLAAAGVPVAKHGNRASSGRCGSADVLEALGIDVEIAPALAGELLQELGLALLFAPRMHPTLRTLAPIRKALAFPTLFNTLGPMCNPASVRQQLLGVARRDLAPVMVQALQRLGSSAVLAATGADGLDELSLSGPSDVVLLRDGHLAAEVWCPEDAGLKSQPLASLLGGDREQNAAILLGVLSGVPGPHADHVALNAGAGLLVAGRVQTWQSGVAVAKDILRAGAARDLLERYRTRATLRQVA